MHRSSRLGRFFELMGRLAYRRPWLVIAVGLAVGAGGVWGMSRLRIDQDLKALLPPDYASVVRLERLRDRIGSQSDFLVAIESPDRAANIAFGRALASRLEAFSELRYVVFDRDVDFFKDRALLYLPLADLLELRRRVIRRIRREVARRTVVDLDDEDDGEEKGRDDTFSVDPDKLMAKHFGGATVPGRFLEADQGRIVVIKARPVEQTTNVAFSARLLKKTRAAIAALKPSSFHPRLRAEVRGEYLEKVGETGSIRGDVVSTVAFAVTLLLVVIGGYFRRVRAVLIVLLPVIVSAVVTISIGVAIFGTFNLVTTFIFAILLGLGIDFAIHCLSRYTFERRRGEGPVEALQLALGSTGIALFAGALTTAGVFFILYLGRFRGFSQFGVVAGIGVLLALLATFTLVPALVSAAERVWPQKFKPLGAVPRNPPGGAPEGAKQRGKWAAWGLVVVSLALAGAAVARVWEIDFEYDFSKLGPRRPHNPAPAATGKDYRDAVGRVTSFGPAAALCSSQAQCEQVTRLLSAVRKVDDREVARLFPASDPALHVAPPAPRETPDEADPDDDEANDPFADLRRSLAGGRLLPEERRLLRALGRRRLQEMRHFLRAFLGLHSFIPSRQRDKLRIVADIRRRIDAKRAVLSKETNDKIDRWYRYLRVSRPVVADQVPRWVLGQLKQTDGSVGRFIIMWNQGSKANYKDSKRLYDAFFNLPVGKEQVPVAANYFVLVEIIDTLREDGPLVLGAAGAVVFVCLTLIFRSPWRALLVLVPLAVSIAWLAGIFLLLGWKLNMFSIVAFPLLVGMGIDNGIHVFHRWRETYCVKTVLREVGGPITLTTLTTFIGFAGLLFAGHVGIQTLGLTAAVGMWLAMLGAVVTLPALLYVLDRRR
jgi:predicted RND superfamily exporter protein